MLSEDFKISTLRAIELFRPLPEGELEFIRPALSVEEYSVGDVLMAEGDPGEELFILLSGEVKVVTGHRQPEETVVRTMGPVEVLGEMSLLTSEPRSATVIATERSHTLVLTKAALDEVLLNHPDICMALLKDAHKRLRTLTQKVAEFSRS